MKKIKINNGIAALCVALLYVEAYLLCIAGRVNSLAALGVHRDYMFVGLMLFTLYGLCHFLPTNIVPKVKTVSLIIVTMAAVLASVVLNTSNSNMGFVIEVIALGLAALLSMFQMFKVSTSLGKQHPNEYVLYEYRVYKLHEQNILNYVFYLAFLGATVLTGFSLVTVIYAIVAGLLIIITNYKVMFGANFNFSSLTKYCTESLCIVGSILFSLLAGRFSLPGYMYFLLAVPVLLYGYYFVRLWREFRYYLYK